ncbi:DUF4224 domain-containing protein [Jeongeupia chitinilytica]|uniref:DUF4224 domain-containing protein n=1 Tax=Jeongeupia chitinilytica TaxID=1041641 RepID=A0ABQ3GV62_9NEIS|nr:DUF4224 domain-containing protein [Jeongeupia chitinilytica]GHD54993.1 hypothetical protein GCM10007350_00050 [Jeongeupia chitinilytica]
MTPAPSYTYVPPSPWLSREELIELAGVDDGTATAARVRRWLRKHGIPFLPALNGWPQVSRVRVRQALGEAVGAADALHLPNFDALD